MTKAKVLRLGKDTFTVLIEDLDLVTDVKAKGSIFKKPSMSPLVGDNVELEKADSDKFIISQIFERKNTLWRYLPRLQKKRHFASNVDLVVIVSACSKPAYKSSLVDRYLVRAAQWGIPALVVINKIDEASGDLDIDLEKTKFSKVAESILCLSAKTGQGDLEELKKSVFKKTALFVGQSGVGKSKLISALCDGEEVALSGGIGKKGKGKHTTTWSEIINYKNFSLVDSPGVRSFSLDDLDQVELKHYFLDLFPLMNQCKFKDCEHKEKSKGCYFQSLNKNDLNHQGTLSRLQSYIRFLDEVAKIPHWKKT